MSSFGEYECVNGVQSNIKVEGVVAGAYYGMNYGEMVSEGHRVVELVKERALPYPSV